MEYLTLSGFSECGGPIYRWWVGIRPAYQGITGFVEVWECEDGTDVAGDTADYASGTASGGYVKRTTFATSGLVERFGITIADVIGGGRITITLWAST